MEPIPWLLEFACNKEKLHQAQDVDNSEHHKKNEIQKDVDRLSELMPQELTSLSSAAVNILSYFMKKKISGEDKILGHEIINSLHLEASQSPEYLHALDELECRGWMELTQDSDSQMKLRPWCWLQARIEMGKKMLQTSVISKVPVEGFKSNGEYLDACTEYIEQLSQRLKNNSKTIICDDDIHQLPEWSPDEQFMEIEKRLSKTTVPIPAAEIRANLKLSGWQHLFLIGLLGYTEKVVKYDFSDINDVVKLFASKYNVRSMMREHLAGKESPLIKYALLDDAKDIFFTCSKPSAKAICLIAGSRMQSKSIDEIRNFASKETLFDVEKPKMDKDALMLPTATMEIIRAIIHAEKPAGRKLRAQLQKNFPSAIGSPTGSTVLLYGPPGTGKTLTASYLASELNVPILKVDCSKILSNYVSDNEKNTRRIFDDYTNMCKMLKKRPVLLLNEADQLLGKRVNPRSAIDQSNNNMQNLFLEALERFDGVLVATTNRKELLDDAYNRRFTYKLELLPPDATTRRKLWESHLPQNLISGQIDLGKLSSYPLTGGEIRLVLEQAVRKAAFNGSTKIEGTMLMEIAGKEALTSNGKQMNRIGFGV